jgi:hypothetical protein
LLEEVLAWADPFEISFGFHSHGIVEDIALLDD